MNPLRHKGCNVCIGGPLCPSLMEIRSSPVSPCFLVVPAAKPQMDHYVSVEWEVKRPLMEIGMEGRDALIQLRFGGTCSKRI